MNVFILCTGRSGSVTFISACQHITNYTAAHESRSSLLGDERFDYPSRHIEADNRLSWMLGRLDKHYGNNAFYVHLKRDLENTARSFAKRSKGIMRAYRGDGIIMGVSDSVDAYTIALDYCHTVSTNIELFLRDKTNKMEFYIENASDLFPQFCSKINADVNLDKALAEFNIRHNATPT
jgi:hypothetical protein